MGALYLLSKLSCFGRLDAPPIALQLKRRINNTANHFENICCFYSCSIKKKRFLQKVPSAFRRIRKHWKGPYILLLVLISIWEWILYFGFSFLSFLIKKVSGMMINSSVTRTTFAVSLPARSRFLSTFLFWFCQFILQEHGMEYS